MSSYTSDFSDVTVSHELAVNERLMHRIFESDAILRSRTVILKESGTRCTVFYMDGMADAQQLNDSVVRPLLIARGEKKEDVAEFLCEKVLFASDIHKQTRIAECIRAVLYGDSVLFAEGSGEAIVINTKGFQTRSISEPVEERVLQGPREGFGETAMINLAMIRRKLLTPDLCVEMQRIGRRTETMVYVCYLGSLADPKTVEELKKRLGKIDIDGILDTNYLAENIRDHRYSLFKTTGSTERPDVVVARLLEGRIAVVVDGTPMVLTVPYLISENFQSDEDYYVNYMYSSVGRLMRYFCFFMAICIPGVYLALITHHKQLLPTSFALSVASLRGGVPLFSVAECMALILIFEILRETELRMSQSLGHALSIVGGLVVGQAAVEARIISAPMLISVALSCIAGLMVPRLKNAVFHLRFLFTVASAFFGLFGLIAMFTVLSLNVLSLDSFGADSTAAFDRVSAQALKDTVIRAPWQWMKTRPLFSRDRVRLRNKGEKQP